MCWRYRLPKAILDNDKGIIPRICNTRVIGWSWPCSYILRLHAKASFSLLTISRNTCLSSSLFSFRLLTALYLFNGHGQRVQIIGVCKREYFCLSTHYTGFLIAWQLSPSLNHYRTQTHYPHHARGSMIAKSLLQLSIWALPQIAAAIIPYQIQIPHKNGKLSMMIWVFQMQHEVWDIRLMCII